MTEEESGIRCGRGIREGQETRHMKAGLYPKTNRKSSKGFNECSYKVRRAFQRSLLSGHKEKEGQEGEG